MTRIKTEYSGAKNGGGYWGEREEAKRVTRRLRRADDRHEERAGKGTVRVATRYRLEYTRQADGAGWRARLVEKPNGCSVVAEGRSVTTRRRIREALSEALDDERAAAVAELVERFRVPEARACESIRKRREQLEQARRTLEGEIVELARTLRKQGYSLRDIKDLLGQ
jgi:hypothetical protein